MISNEIREIAERVVKDVVDCIAQKRYEDLYKYTNFSEDLSLDTFKECVEGYLELNELPYIDKYGVSCNFQPNYEYKQLSVYVYNNGTGFAVDYDLSTDQELNDLTLQMEFLYDETGGIKSYILDAHVL